MSESQTKRDHPDRLLFQETRTVNYRVISRGEIYCSTSVELGCSANLSEKYTRTDISDNDEISLEIGER